MNDYPINSFLFWKVDKTTAKEYQFYEFLKEYHEKNSKHNPEAHISGQDDITVVIDGQQRLTSLYIALRGSYTTKKPYGRKKNSSDYYTHYLYLNLKDLVNCPDEGEEEKLRYDFRFMQEHQVMSDSRYFRVSKILDFQDKSKIDDYLRKGYFYDEYNSTERDVIKRNLYKLYEVIHEKELIGYYEETSQDIDKIVEIFIRLNNGGTPLKLFDIFWSHLISQWSGDLRKELNDFTDDLEQHSKVFDKRFIATALLALSDIENINFKIENLTKSNTEKMEKQWENIKKYIRLSIKLVKSFGFEAVHYTSANIFIPIAYYLQKIGADNSFIDASRYADDRENIRQWFIRSMLKQVFRGADTVFTKKLRQLVRNSDNTFPLKEISEYFEGDSRKTLKFSDDDIDKLLSYKYGDKNTFSVLSLLYPILDFKNKFHIDHIFPKSKFTDKNLMENGVEEYSDRDKFKNKCDFLANLQLLEGIINQEKNNKDFDVWLEEKCPDQSQRRDYCVKHYIPQDIDLSFNNFLDFFAKRRELIRDRLKEILQM